MSATANANVETLLHTRNSAADDFFIARTAVDQLRDELADLIERRDLNEDRLRRAGERFVKAVLRHASYVRLDASFAGPALNWAPVEAHSWVATRLYTSGGLREGWRRAGTRYLAHWRDVKRRVEETSKALDEAEAALKRTSTDYREAADALAEAGGGEKAGPDCYVCGSPTDLGVWECPYCGTV